MITTNPLCNGRYDELVAQKDIHILVFISIFLLKVYPLGGSASSFCMPASSDGSITERTESIRESLPATPPPPGHTAATRKISLEYFDPSRSRRRQGSPYSTPASNPSTPVVTPGGYPPVPNSPSSKSSWTSLLTTSGMGQLVKGLAFHVLFVSLLTLLNRCQREHKVYSRRDETR